MIRSSMTRSILVIPLQDSRKDHPIKPPSCFWRNYPSTHLFKGGWVKFIFFSSFHTLLQCVKQHRVWDMSHY
jgi:hypothetical protein